MNTDLPGSEREFVIRLLEHLPTVTCRPCDGSAPPTRDIGIIDEWYARGLETELLGIRLKD